MAVSTDTRKRVSTAICRLLVCTTLVYVCTQFEWWPALCSLQRNRSLRLLRGADQLSATVHSLLRFSKRLHERSGQNYETCFVVCSTSCCTSFRKEFERTVCASISLKCRRFLECAHRMVSLRPPAPPLDLFWAECARNGEWSRYAPCYASRPVFGRMCSKR